MTDIDEIARHHQRFMETVFRARGEFHAQGVLFVRPSAMMRVAAEQGIAAPGAFEALPDDEPRPIPCMVDDQPPHVLAAKMRFLAEKMRPAAAVMMVEAWMAKATDDDVKADRRASQMPNREEVLMLVVETADGRVSARVSRIVRDAAGKGTLTAWKKTARDGLAGRLTGILPPTNPQ